MKILNILNLSLMPDFQKDTLFLSVGSLNDAIEKYFCLIKRNEKLNLQYEIFADETGKIFLNKQWHKQLNLLEASKILLDNYKVVLNELKKSVSKFKEKDLSNIYNKNKKDHFIYTITNYELELNRYSEFITKTEKLKKELILHQGYSR